MKIDKTTSATIQQSLVNSKPSETVPAKASEKSIQAHNKIDTRLSNQALSQLSQMDDIDLAKVEDIKSALARGEISLDIEALSSAMMTFHAKRK